jgi:hypothetical protein
MEESMLIRLKYDRCGSLLIDPVNKRTRKRCVKEVIEQHKCNCPDMHTESNREDTVKWLSSQSVIFVQREADIACTLYDLGMAIESERGELPASVKGLHKQGRANRRQLEQGWSVAVHCGQDTFDTMFCCYN